MTTTEIDYEGFADLDAHRFLWMAMLHLPEWGFGAHAIYLTLDSQHSTFSAPAAVLRRFPETLTIVLENQYQELRLRRDGFSVTLHFDGKPATLVAGWGAVVAYQDMRADYYVAFNEGLAAEKPTRAPVADNVVEFPHGGRR